jgi:hypothetical protein
MSHVCIDDNAGWRIVEDCSDTLKLQWGGISQSLRASFTPFPGNGEQNIKA